MSRFVEYTEPKWRDLNMRALKVDQAYLILKSFFDKETYLYTLSDECYTCPHTKIKSLTPLATETGEITKSKLDVLPMKIASGINFRIFEYDVGRYAFENETSMCNFYRNDLDEFGVYNLTVFRNGTCALITDKPGVDVNISILTVFLLFALIFAVYRLSLCAWRTYRYEEEVALAASSSEEILEPTTSHKRRLRSLDAFRGIAIVLMIFVNSGGGAYTWIEHAPWNGLHIADVVFPSFLWIMGVCIPISVKSQLSHGMPKVKICSKIIWRSFKLFGIGVCLNSLWGSQLENLRVMGVLQRFGIAYLLCGIVHVIFCKTELYLLPQAGWKRAIYELILLKGELFFMFALIATHLGIIFGLNIPDCPKGYLGPGGKHHYAAYPKCIGGATGYIDLYILGEAHIYQHPTARAIYDSSAFDPEGIFGSLLTIVQVFTGVLAGVIILTHNDWQSRLKRWIFWSIFLGLIGGALCLFTQEEGPIPINKNLWSLSFVCVTTAISFLMLSTLYFIIDVRQWWSGTPFVEAGMNSIIMYVGHSVMHKTLPWHWRIGEMNTHFILLFESVWNTLLWIGISLYLNDIKFYYSL